MPVEQIKISAKELPSFQSILDKAITDPKNKNVVLFFTNPSWCPDCVEAEDIVNEFINELPEDRSVALIVEVEREPYKAADAWETYLYRKHPQIRLRSIPTLMVWNAAEKEGPQQARLEEFHNPRKIAQFKSQYIH